MAFSTETKLGEILANPNAYAVLAKHFPDIKSAGPMLAMAKGLTLTALSKFPQAKMSPDKLKALIDELQTI